MRKQVSKAPYRKRTLQQTHGCPCSVAPLPRAPAPSCPPCTCRMLSLLPLLACHCPLRAPLRSNDSPLSLPLTHERSKPFEPRVRQCTQLRWPPFVCPAGLASALSLQDVAYGRSSNGWAPVLLRHALCALCLFVIARRMPSLFVQPRFDCMICAIWLRSHVGVPFLSPLALRPPENMPSRLAMLSLVPIPPWKLALSSGRLLPPIECCPLPGFRFYTSLQLCAQGRRFLCPRPGCIHQLIFVLACCPQP